MSSARTLALIATASAIYACSSSSSKRVAEPLDGGSDGALPYEDSGKPGSGGKAAVEAGAGGAGTGGALPEASVPDATVGDAPDATTDAAPPALVCRAGGAGDGGILADGGPRDRGEWRDFATNRCGACPAPGLDCSTFDASSSEYDPATRTLKLFLNPSVTEIVSGTLSLQYQGTDAIGDFFRDFVDNVPITVSGNTISADLSALVPHGVELIYSINGPITDACGATTYLQFGALGNSGDAAKPELNVHCEQ